MDHGIQPRLRYKSVANVSYSHDRKARSRSSVLLPGYKPDPRTAAGTHTTLKPTASKVAQALRVCSGDVTTAIVLQPLARAIARILSASVRVVVTESVSYTHLTLPTI